MSETGFTKGRRPVGRTVSLRAPAKVNLHLEVLRRRHDGYHEIETVLQAIVPVRHGAGHPARGVPGGEPHLDLALGGDVAVPMDETNLCWRAAHHFCRENGVSGRISLQLDKTIPAGAGLGGGSADAAAVLLACDRLFATGLETARAGEAGRRLSVRTSRSSCAAAPSSAAGEAPC